MQSARLVLLAEVLVLAMGLSQAANAHPFALPRPAIATGEREGTEVALAKGKGKKGKGKGKGKRAKAGVAPPDGAAPVNGKKKRGKKGKKSAEEVAAPTPEPETAPEAPRQLPSPPTLPTAYTAVALAPVQAFEVPDEVSHSIEQTLLDEIDQLPGFRSVSPEDLQSDLVTLGLKLDECDRDVTCLAQRGRYGRSHLLVETRLSALGGANAISLRVIDTVKAQEINRAAEPMAEGVQGQAQQIHRMVAQLLTPDAYEGNMSFTCDVSGAEVYLDDKLLGTTPLPAQEHLHAGVHILRVSKVGYSDINRFVDVVYNRSSTVQLSLNTATVAGTIVEMRSTAGFGDLFIASQEPGWEIRIDGEPLGMTPLNAAINKIPAGKRHITMKKAGAPAVAFDVTVQEGRRTDALLNITPNGPVFVPGPIEDPAKPLPTIDALLNPPPPPPPSMVEVHTFPTWRLWTAVGVGGAGVASLAAASYFANEVRGYNNQAKGLESTIHNAQDWNTLKTAQAQLTSVNQQGQNAEKLQWITLGVGGALAVTGAGFLIWDLFHTELQAPHTAPAEPAATPGAPTPAPGAAPAAVPAPPKTSLYLAPIFHGGGGGLQFSLVW